MRITNRFFVVYILNFFVSVLGVGDGRFHGSWVFEDFEVSLIVKFHAKREKTLKYAL